MGTKIADSAPEPKPDPQVAEFEKQKKLFEEAVAKTQGTAPAEPAAEAAPEPKPKKARKPKAEPHPLEAEVATLRAQVAELSKPKEVEPTPDERTELARSKLAQRFGEDEANDLIDTFNELRGEDRRRVEQLERVIEGATRAGRANLSKSNQRRLSGDFPQLKNEGAWKIVHEQALAAFEKDPKSFEDLEDAYDQTALALYGEPADDDEGEDVPEDVQRVASRIAASQMTVPTKAPKREARSYEERAKEHFEWIKKNPQDKLGAIKMAIELGLRK